MKWLSTRYAYPLVILSLAVSIGLQLVWIMQLFRAQRLQLNNELEQVISKASKEVLYGSIVRGHEQSTRFRQFFLSPEWLKLRQAFDDLKVDELHSEFHYGITSDSSVVEIRFSFLNDSSKKKAPGSGAITAGLTHDEISRVDQRNLKQMDSLVHTELHYLGISTPIYYALYDYSSDRMKSTTLSKPIKTVAYASKRYTYNLNFLHKYQVLLPSIDTIILYRMRYYLASSFIMILLTACAFYLILKLLRNQRLYGEARIAFTTNMTHELKTPIATVTVALESISKYSLINEPEKLKNYLDISRYELQRLNFMIEKVLNSEQMENGETPLHLDLYDVQAGLEQIITSMNLQVEQSHAKITVVPSDEPCFVNADPVHLTNVFYNLIENALKYGDMDVQILIYCTLEVQNVVISFNDNGPGIDVIYHERIFERFFRVTGNNNIHNVKGSGLGLHYVKQIVEKHGGSIKLNSKLGNGCNFLVYLPRYHEE